MDTTAAAVQWTYAPGTPVAGLEAEAAHASLVQLGRWLQEADYRFTTVTPRTQKRVNARPVNAEARSLRDVFGWSRPFCPQLLPDAFLRALDQAGALLREGGHLRSAVRYSSLDHLLLVHSAFPTTAADAVFFGPDTLRFAQLLRRVLGEAAAPRVRSLLDLGCGNGAGGLFAASLLRGVNRLCLADVNPAALRHARINAALTGVPAEFLHSDGLAEVDGQFDLIVSNPPYLAGGEGRVYREGGGPHGSELSLRFVREALPRLNPGGRMLLYSGSPIIAGKDPVRAALASQLQGQALTYTYEELDPDIFGEELDKPAYADVERIAAIALVVRKDAA